MSDRELLELAAKAMEIDVRWIDEWNGFFIHRPHKLPGEWPMWNPLTDDVDAFRLAVKLGISIHMGTYKVVCEVVPQEDDGNIVTKENCVSDPYAATRRAIVRAAAEIGKAMGSES